MARADRSERVLGSDGLRWECQQQRSQRGGNQPDQALSDSGTTSGRMSGTIGISGG